MFDDNGSHMGLPEQVNTYRLSRIFESGATHDPLDEILALLPLANEAIDPIFIVTFHSDIEDIFSGYYPGFRENGNRYHNLRHTYSVALAAARLYHGLTLEGYEFSEEILLRGMLSAYFHDTGLLLRSFDTTDNGAEFTRYHEARSISALFKYLESYNFDDKFRVDCASIIRCTNLDLDLESIEFSSPEIRLSGQILATADILAQMADRYYLEQLPFLFQEHRAGGLNRYESAFELMRDTTAFYHHFISDRLKIELGNVARAMRIHFSRRWNLDRNPYIENIETNIAYLQRVISHCDNLEQLTRYLRREPPFKR